MVEGWEWDESLFEGAAPYYERGRLPYAPGLVAALTSALDLDPGRGRLLDVGCGPGTLALRLAGRFAEVVGVDPDAGMLAEARRAAGGTGGTFRWVRARAEQLPPGLGTFTVATFGNSFHWMDQDAVAATVRDLLRPGGAFVHVADLKNEPRPAEAAFPHPPVPRPAVDALVRSYLGPLRRAGRGVLPHGTPGGEAEALARAGFAAPVQLILPAGQFVDRTHDDVVAGTFSLSSSAPHLFGSRLPAFEADLRALLHAASPATGLFSERLPATEVRIWRRVSH